MIRYEVRDGVAHVIIDRPEKKGAMTYGILADFYAAVQRAGTDDGVGAVIVEGTGGAFCAGTDLSDLNDTPTEDRGRRGAEGSPPPLVISACPRPVVGAIDGPAVGMGAEFATQCDVRIASTRARFGWVFVLRGLVADTGAGTFLLPRIVGYSEAMRLLFSGDIIDAQTALDIGFVSQVVAPDDLPAAAEEEAQRYRKGSPFAIARMKRLVYDGMTNDVTTHVAQTAALLRECFASHDHAEGVAAFLERRPANFTGQ
ncbi:MAG TPA: enoyl-CoA hydratase-related protein [Acidimicrobiales bacterium]|nr:enoyl-CoA hydratase-related protein [Acidimicrobiales bacterium]